MAMPDRPPSSRAAKTHGGSRGGVEDHVGVLEEPAHAAVVEVEFTRVDGVVADDAQSVESLLNLDGKSLADQRRDVVVNVVALLAQIAAVRPTAFQVQLECHTAECILSGPSFR
jgi:hypothetical protein